MNAHEIALAAHTRAESAAQGRDAHAAAVTERIANNLLAGIDTSWGARHAVDASDVADEIDIAALIAAANAIPAHERMNNQLARLVIQAVWKVADKNCDLVMDYESDCARAEAAYDRAERAR